MSFKKILVTGCGGMLGEAVYKYVKEHKLEVKLTDLWAIDDWLEVLDVRNLSLVEKMVKEYKPDLILHLAAMTDLEICEVDAENAMRTNAIGTENMALMAKKYGATMVYISTAGEFDGLKDSYFDNDLPNPINVYGVSKHAGELFCQRYLEKYYIFRAGWMMGGGPKKDKKFINKVYQQIKNGARELMVVNDKFGTPTYTYDFVKGIFKTVETGWYGIYNQVCLGDTSREEVMRVFVEEIGLKDKIKINVVSSEVVNRKFNFFAKRPTSEKLINQKLLARGICQMRNWKTCLQEYAILFKKDLETK